MKKFRILGIIAIIAILANFIGGLDEDWKDFKKGFEEGQSGATEMYESGHHMITRVKLNVKPLSGTTVDSLNNNRVDSPLPYTVTEIETYAKPSAWYILVIGLAIPGLFFFLIGFYSLIRLLISISRRKVFTPANVLRLRWFAYTSASLKILTAIGEWLTGSAAMNHLPPCCWPTNLRAALILITRKNCISYFLTFVAVSDRHSSLSPTMKDWRRLQTAQCIWWMERSVKELFLFDKYGNNFLHNFVVFHHTFEIIRRRTICKNRNHNWCMSFTAEISF